MGTLRRRCCAARAAPLALLLATALRPAPAAGSLESDKAVPEQMLFGLVPGEPADIDVWWTVADTFAEFSPACSSLSVRYGRLSDGLYNISQTASCISVTNISATIGIAGLWAVMVRARMRGLMPNTTYALYVTGFQPQQSFVFRGALSTTHFLRTLPAGSGWAPRLAFFGDLSTSGHVMPLVQHLSTAGRVDAVFHSGESTAHTFTHAPYIACPGAPGGLWRQLPPSARPGLPGGELRWAADVGAVRVVAVDTSLWTSGGDALSEIYQWLKGALTTARERRSEVPWVVFFARGAAAGADAAALEGPADGDKHPFALLPLLAEMGVDLCIWGGGLGTYAADYSRHSGAGGLRHVALGAGKPSGGAAAPAGADSSSSERGYGVLTADGPHLLRWEYRACGWGSCGGDLIDQFQVRGKGEQVLLPRSHPGVDGEAASELPKGAIPSGEVEELKNRVEVLLLERQELLWENERLAKQLRSAGRDVALPPYDRDVGTTWDASGWESAAAVTAADEAGGAPSAAAAGVASTPQRPAAAGAAAPSPRPAEQQPQGAEVVGGADMLWGSAGVCLVIVAFALRMWKTKGIL